MAKIKILAPQIANMIAAGEVVERPSSVVKELVENAIDAGSTLIEIRIKDAGRTSIQVDDNGSGMDKDDAILAFTRHATSKIVTKSDLFEIATLGFRGEALPSIASVSKVTLQTSTGLSEGCKVVVHQNQILTCEPSISKKGTSLLVENLFYNTPARLKHLKSDLTEMANISEIVNKLSLCYPNIVFRLYHQDALVFQTTGRGDVLEVIANIYGNDFAKNLLPIAFENNDFAVSGYIGKHFVSRPSRKYITCMLNHRPIRLPSIYSLLGEAYRSYLPSERFPVAFIAIEADYQLVDVNVHPSKSEVRLSKDDSLTKLLKEGLSKALDNKLSFPDVKINPAQEVIQPTLDLDRYIESTPSLGVVKEIQEEPAVYIASTPSSSPSLHLQAIGQIHGTYIVAQSSDGFYVVDQHAAVERINYEKLEKLYASTIVVTKLLIPYVIELNYNDIIAIQDRLWCFEPLGLEVEVFGHNALRFLSLPTWIEKADALDYLNLIIEEVLKGNTNIFKLRSHSIASLACRDSLKSNQYLTLEAMQELLDGLLQCKNPNNCPHGRPTMIFYSKYELEKLFKRTGF